MFRTEAFFLPMHQGNRFCLLHQPGPHVHRRGAILFIHPFAEEMNNARRVAGLQARAFAKNGWVVLQMDLFGCGDSAGDFEDASWEHWIGDVIAADAWLNKHSGHEPVLWGLRVGCLLATLAVSRIAAARDFIFWQPVISGKQYLQHFLRLKVAQQVIHQRGEQLIGTRELRQQLERGESIEVAGYVLSPGLALGLEKAALEPPVQPARAAWLEVAHTSELSPVARTQLQRWVEAGHRAEARVAEGVAFWQVPGTAECSALIESTLALVDAVRA